MQHNQTPGEAKVVGTFRAYDVRDSETIASAIRDNLDGLMRTFGTDAASPPRPSYVLEAEPAYPPLVNNPSFTKRAAEVLKQSFKDVDDQMEPNLGAEDFACYLERVPGLFMFLGGGNPELGITAMNHSDRFDMDEACLPVGIRALLTLAADFQQSPSSYLGRLPG
jgi:metal-dependent amidase/aminoacylase/carboxypeptidase family protein